MIYEDFRKQTLKANTKKGHFRINKSLGAKEAWRWLKKNKWLDLGQEITESQMRVIIDTLNQTLQDQLLNQRDINLPLNMGRIEVRKFETKKEFVDGKIKTNLAIDWDATLRLWHEDNYAKEHKILIRCETSERFRIIYNKRKAKYNNKTFYEFNPTRDLRIKLKNKIKTQGFDALLFQ